MPPTKKSAKSKERVIRDDSQSQEDEPDLEILSRELEKRSKRAKKSTDDSREGASTSRALAAPESLSSDLIQEMRSELAVMKKQGEEQKSEMKKLRAKMVAREGVDYQWKKEGNRKQFEIIQKFMLQTLQAKDRYRTEGIEQGETELENLVLAYKERIKMLRIADTSPHGWQTVQEYEVNPIARDEADDQKLRRAAKAAQDKATIRAQERRAKQAKYSPYGQGQNNNFRSQNYGQDNQKPDYGYKAYGGFKNQNAYKSSTVVPDKSTPKRNINNDICFSCGSRGHWANHCPEKKQEEAKST